MLSKYGLRKVELYFVNFPDYKIVCDFSRSKSKSCGGLVILTNKNEVASKLNIDKLMLQGNGI